MSDTIKPDGGPAFPRGIKLETPCCGGKEEHDRVCHHNKVTGGMSLRTWLVGCILPAAMTEAFRYCPRDQIESELPKVVAGMSCSIADAVIAELNK